MTRLYAANHRQTFIAIQALTAAIMACGLAVHADQIAPAKTNETVRLPEVKVTGTQESTYKPDAPALPKFTEPLRDTPQSISVIPRQTMDDQGATTLRDALRNVAGISIAAGEGGSQGDNLTLRGFPARNDLFLDGMRDFGSYYRDPFNLEQVDVLKGPSSVMFGRGSTGGVVNEESKVPFMKPQIAGTIGFGTDLTKRATLDINEPIKAWGEGTALRFNAMGDSGEVAGRDVATNRRWGLAPSLTFGLGTPTRTTVSYFHTSANDTPDYGIPWFYDHPAPVPRNNYYGNEKDNFLKTDVDILTFRVEHDVNDHIKVRDQLRAASYVRAVVITEPKVITNALPTVATAMVNRNELNSRSAERMLQNQVDVTADFDTGKIHHTAVAGLEAGFETSDPARKNFFGVAPVSLLHPNEDQRIGGSSTNATRINTSANAVALYGLDTLKLGKKWELTGGLRYDHFQATARQTVPTNGAYGRTDDMLSWRGSLVFKPTKNGSVYFTYGTSFNPSAESLSITPASQAVKPEENTSYELGTKWDLLSERLSLRAALFRTDKDNARESNPTNALLAVVAGKQRVQGVELEAQGQITEAWNVFAGYDYMDSEILSSKFYPGSVGYPVANAPKNTFTAWTTYKLPWRVTLGGGGRFVDNRTANSTVPLDPVSHQLKQVGGYWTFDAMAQYEINKHACLQLNVYNIADTYYIDQIHNSHLVPGAGRSALLTLNYKF